MFFPFKIRYTRFLNKCLSDNEASIALDRIKTIVQNNGADHVDIMKNQLSFKINFFGHARGNWNILVPIEKGNVKLLKMTNKTALTYEIFLYRLTILTIVISIIVGIVSNSTKTAIYVFLFLFIGNWLMAFSRHNGLIKYFIAEINSLITKT